MDRSIKEKEQGEKILGFCVCAQEYQKPKPLMCIYTIRNLELKFCVGWVNPQQIRSALKEWRGSGTFLTSNFILVLVLLI